MNQETTTQTTQSKFPPRRLIFGVVFVIIALLIARFTFITVRDFIATWSLTSLPGMSVKTQQNGEAQTTPLAEGMQPTATPQPAQALLPTPQPWDGATRVNVLVMGLDYRDWEAGEGPPRSDTMILLTLDPVSMTGGMLSIPRDLWVSIPGYGYGKINTAYQIGEGLRLPGGGPALAVKTVEALLGVEIQYYAQIDFSAFERFIDEIGGVKLNVPEKIKVDLIGDDKGSVVIKPGVQTLPGAYALAYARARNTEGGDFDRAQRQQQVILAIRQRILSFNLIPILFQKAPQLYAELSSGINTNMSLDDAFRLAYLAQQVPDENIKRGIIGTEHVTFGKSPDGLDILKPIPDKIRLLRDELFTESGPLKPYARDDKELLELMLAENPRIILYNGTFTPGLAGRTQEYLQSLGANVIFTADSDEKPYAYTVIYDYTGNPYTVQYFVDLMNISQYRIFLRFAPESEADIAIILGDDWTANNPMP